MTDHPRAPAVPVAIVGAGPVGLSVAFELARHGVRSVLLERKTSTSDRSKAAGLHVRTREIFRGGGIEDRFLDAGMLERRLTLHDAAGRRPRLSMDFSELDREADRAGVLFLEQSETERILLECVRETGLCDVRFGAEAVGLDARADGVELRVREKGGTLPVEAAFAVGCDGASSFVREALGLPFEGITYSLRPMLADVRVEDERDGLPWPRLRDVPGGLLFTLRLAPGLWRIVHLERGGPETTDEVTRDELDARVAAVLGPGRFERVWANRFRIHRRASPQFRAGRVLLAGDAAHVHSPAGGLGMNAGIQDAHNLAWKLAYALRGADTDRLLDSYDTERRSVVVGNVTRYTDLVTRTLLQTPGIVREAAFVLLRSALKIRRLRRRVLRRATMLDLDYPGSPILDAGERAAGRRLPNAPLRAQAGEEVRLYDLLPAGPVMLDIGDERALPGGLGVADVIHIGPSGYLDPTGVLCALLGGGRGWILVRPDAHVAWARDTLDGIDEAVRHALGGASAG